MTTLDPSTPTTQHGPHRFKLGDRVTFTGTIEKTHSKSRTLYLPAHLPLCYDKQDGGVPYTEGVVVGRRIVQDGETRYDYEVGGIFRAIPGTARRVWLVAFDLRRKPVMVADGQIERAADDHA